MHFLLFRRKTIITVGIILIIKLLLLIALVSNKIMPAFNLFADRPIVVLDAGHGGVDKGTAKKDISEKDINLDIVLRIAEFLGDRGVAVDLTRATDVDLGGKLQKGRHRKDLEARVKKFNQGIAAVSIHVNSGGSEKEGAIIFYPKDNEEAKYFAELVLKEVGMVQVLEHNYAVPRANLYVLKNTKIPTILVEVGFITNSLDRNKLTNPEWRQQIAEAIGTGILKYLSIGN